MTYRIAIILIGLLVAGGCSGDKNTLTGKWITGAMDNEMFGRIRIILEFRDDGVLRIGYCQPDDDREFLSRQSLYQLRGGQVISDLFDEADYPRYRFSGSTLLLKVSSEPERRLTRLR
jgi:hypothetical protein